MAKIFMDRWLARGANLATFWPLLPAGVVGVLLAWSSQGVAWISSYGLFGWLVVALVGFLLTTLGLYGVAKVRERFAFAQATRKWAKAADAVNPLAPEFGRQRIHLFDLVHPLNPRVTKRRFTGSELLGRANVVLIGDVLFAGTLQFGDCDVVVVNTDVGVPINNAIIMDSCQFFDCQFVRCTFFVSQENYDKMFKPLELIPITYERPTE